jgi:hypothetical protein
VYAAMSSTTSVSVRSGSPESVERTSRFSRSDARSCEGRRRPVASAWALRMPRTMRTTGSPSSDHCSARGRMRSVMIRVGFRASSMPSMTTVKGRPSRRTTSSAWSRRRSTVLIPGPCSGDRPASAVYSAAASSSASVLRASTAASTAPVGTRRSGGVASTTCRYVSSARNSGSLNVTARASSADFPEPASPVTTRVPSSPARNSSRRLICDVRPVKYQPVISGDGDGRPDARDSQYASRSAGLQATALRACSTTTGSGL